MKAKLEKRIKDFLKLIHEHGDSYRGDPDMSEKRIDIYRRWLREICSNMKELAKRLNEKELSFLLDAVEGVSSMKYFVFGTEYGSGYGIRPVLEITRNILERGEILGNEEMRVTYVSALGEIYKKTRQHIDPKYYYDGEDDKKVNNGYVLELNQKINENPSEVLCVVTDFMQKSFVGVEE